MTKTLKHAGLCAGGADWPYSELEGLEYPEKMEFLKSLGYRQAACVAHSGGDYVRTLYMTATILGRWEFHDKVHLFDKPPYEFGWQEYESCMREIVVAMEDTLRRIDEGADLDWTRMDAYFAGVKQFNAEMGPDHHVHALLCLVEVPPRMIVEKPQFLDCPSFKNIWHLYTQIHIKMMRAVVRRYCVPEDSCVQAIEVINEPDYNWIPDECRIEMSLRPHANPMWKYITELHMPQMPQHADHNHAFVTDAAGVHFAYELDHGLIGKRTAKPVPVLDFPWGAKFDRYLACLADLHEHVSFAAKDEAAKARVPLTVVSGAVTNNNLDYLVRMYRANKSVFDHVDAIGLHPYHWPGHSMHDMNFVSSRETAGWTKVDPQSFCNRYYKRYDFLKEIAALTKMKDRKKSFGMAGKKLWLTEFGIPTKKCAHANAHLADYVNLFIYQRGEQIPEPISAIVWEDKWDRFFDQSTLDWMDYNNIETILFYTMRGGGIGESTDYEHSNFTLFDLDCRTTRMERSTFERLVAHSSSITGRGTNVDYFDFVGPSTP